MWKHCEQLAILFQWLHYTLRKNDISQKNPVNNDNSDILSIIMIIMTTNNNNRQLYWAVVLILILHRLFYLYDDYNLSVNHAVDRRTQTI